MFAVEPSPIDKELSSNETVLWSGRPKQGFVFYLSDILTLPVTLFWLVLVLFWLAFAFMEEDGLLMLNCGMPFILIIGYSTIGRFIVDRVIRSKTIYAVTNQRAIIVTGFFNRTVKSLNLKTVSEITMKERRNGSGTITFGSSMPYTTGYRRPAWQGDDRHLLPQFEMIPDVKSVYALILQARQS